MKTVSPKNDEVRILTPAERLALIKELYNWAESKGLDPINALKFFQFVCKTLKRDLYSRPTNEIEIN